MVLTTQHLELLRGLEQEDFMAMELEDLERISNFCDFAFATRKKQLIEELENQKLQFEKKEHELLEFEPKIQELFASKPIKFNVGGSQFATNLQTIIKEPNTYFAILFSGRWEPKLDPVDGSVFIDRDPTMFGMILNYLRTGKINLVDLTRTQREQLREEVDFYQIGSLLALLSPQHAFCAQVKGSIVLSNNNKMATMHRVGEELAVATSLMPFSATCSEMKFKIVDGHSLMIGVAPRDILQRGEVETNCGWYVYSNNGSLFGQNGAQNAPYTEDSINKGSTVTVKLDSAFNISFAVDGLDKGIAFRAVVKDYSVPLYLAVGLYEVGTCIEML